MFTGREYFPELGLYDYRNRFYHPALGRFLQGDPMGFGGGDANLFRYCGGDPVNHSDSTGMAASGGSGGGKGPPVPIKPYEPKTSWNLGISHDPNAPIGTQGFWSTLSGLPTGTASFLAESLARAAGFEGFDADTGAPIYRAQPADSSVSNGASVIGDIIGKIWALPNTIIGFGLAVLTGAHFEGFLNNAAVFTGSDFVAGFAQAITFGNVQIYGTNSYPSDYGSSPYTPGFSMYTGFHEEGHTYQSQFLGPLFLPFYGIGQLFGGSVNPFETGADNYANTHQPPPPPGGG